MMMELIMLRKYIVFLIFFVTLSNAKNPVITSLHILSDIKYRFSTTLVTSTVANRENSSVEAKFEVTLPDAAFITDFVMKIDGVLYPGEINEKQKAKEKYESAKKKGQSAGHVSQKPRHTNRFSVDVNVAALSSVIFNLTYQELLERVYGEYEHIIYIDPGQVVEDLQIKVTIKESKRLSKVSVPPIRTDIIEDTGINEGQNALVNIERPTPNTAIIQYAPTEVDQQQQSDQGISGLFVVEYDIERKKDAGEVMVVNGYFIHYFAPEGFDPVPQDVVFVLDKSGSMSGRKIEQQKNAMNKILQDLHEGDRFNIIAFSSSDHLWKPNLVSATKENKDMALQYVENMSAGGSTDIIAGMNRAIAVLNNDISEGTRIKMIVFLTDGQGDDGADHTLRVVSAKNIKNIAIFSLAFGQNADYAFVKRLALDNGGIARQIFEDSDASLQIKGFYDEISTSALQNVTFKYLGDNKDIVQNSTQMNFNTYFSGKELVVAGKLLDNDVEAVYLFVTGSGADGSIELKLKSDVKDSLPDLTKVDELGSIVERIWAYLTIKELLEKAIGERDENKKQELNDKALALSLQYKFVTPLTSMVVTKPEEKDVGSYEEDKDAQLAVAANKRGSSASQKPPPTRRRPQRGGGGGGGGSSGGGGGGDPHFMIRLNGSEIPVCFDIDAKGESFLQLLKDPSRGVTINAGITGSKEKKRNGEYKTFINELLIFATDVRIYIKSNDILFNDASLSWNDEYVFELKGVKLKVNAKNHYKTLSVDLGNNIVVEIRRHMKNDTHIDVDYLNMFIDDERGISQKASGVLGQFVHSKIKLTKVTIDGRGRMRGHFVERGPRGHTHFMTILHKKPDVITGEMKECWNAYSKVAGLLQDSIYSFFVKSLYVV